MNIIGSRPTGPIERVSASTRPLSDLATADVGAASAALVARATIDNARQTSAIRREGKLTKLETQVREGNYQADAPAIARAILADAETKVGLTALLAH